MDPVTIALIVTAGGIGLINYLQSRTINTKVDVKEILEKYYKPEPCDIKMMDQCVAMLEKEFPIPQELCLWDRIKTVMTDLSVEDRKLLIKELADKIANVMMLEPAPSIDIDEIPYCGVYKEVEDKITISANLLEEDALCVLVVRTLIHEMKHSVQWRALQPGGNIWGYSDDLLAEWALNNMNYINAQENPEGYFKQAVEIDSYGFETCMIQNPEAIINFEFEAIYGNTAFIKKGINNQR